MSWVRKCSDLSCMADVKHRGKDGGYCEGKPSHWNDPRDTWGRPVCECGADATKSASNPCPRHSTYCSVHIWEKE